MTGGTWQLALPEVDDGAILESSTDLIRWIPLLLRHEGKWQVQDESDLTGVEIMDSNALRIPGDRPRMFFRLGTP